MKHYFVDTNIVIDMLANRQPFADAASAVFDAAGRCEVKLSICSLSFSNIYYIVRKELGHDATIQSLKILAEVVTILPVDKEIIHLALSSPFTDYEDAIQYYSALNDSTIDGIVTRNPKDFKHSALPIINPQSFL